MDGLELIGIQELAIAVEKHQIEVEAEKKQPYAAPNAVILRLVAAGISSPTQISDFMGLDESLVATLIVEEIHEGTLARSDSTVELTGYGQKILQDFLKTKLFTKKLSIGWDSLGGFVTDMPKSERQLEDFVNNESSAIEAPKLRPSRSSNKSKKHVFTTDEVNERLSGDITVLRITKQRSSGANWYYIAHLLIYSDSKGTQVEYRLLVDGQESLAHKSVVNSGPFIESMPFNIEAGEQASGGNLQLDEVKSVAPDKYESLVDRLVDFSYELEEEPDPSILRAEAQHSAQVIRQFSVYEHPPFLEQALLTASKRLMIVSPWITRRVVDETFVKKLERLLERNVMVDIIFGIKDDTTSSKQAISQLCRLSDSFPNFRFYRHGNNHSKILIVDDTVITTSFNWLSFKGDSSLTFRREEGTLVKGEGYANDYYDGWQTWISNECLPACNSN